MFSSVFLSGRPRSRPYLFSSPEPSGSKGDLIDYLCSGDRRRHRPVNHFQR